MFGAQNNPLGSGVGLPQMGQMGQMGQLGFGGANPFGFGFPQQTAPNPSIQPNYMGVNQNLM